MANASLSLQSVAEDVTGLETTRFTTTNASLTLCSVPEDIRGSRASLQPSSACNVGLTASAPSARSTLGRGTSAKNLRNAMSPEEYEEDFEDYSGSEDGRMPTVESEQADNDGQASAQSCRVRPVPVPIVSAEPLVETPISVGIGAGRFTSAEELSPSWESSSAGGWSASLASGDHSPLSTQGRQMKPPKLTPAKALALDMEELENEQSGSATWSYGPGGAMRHKPTDTRVSAENGITFEGRQYQLSFEDIDFDPSPHLGAGSGGVVTKGRIRKTGALVAVKTISVDDRAKREQLMNEIRSLVQAEGCPNLVQWYAGFVSTATGKVHVALEFMDRGSLADLSKRLRGDGVPLAHLSCIASQILGGLEHLHSRRVLHRDIKPENILHNARGEVKLTDFGIAKDLEGTLAMACTFIGTATYMAPERCLGEDYSLASDIWSVGMILFQLAAGRYPFSDVSSFPALLNCLCDKPEPRLDGSRFPAACCDFVARCLTREVARRPDTASLSKHDFVADRDGGAARAKEEFAEWLHNLERNSLD